MEQRKLYRSKTDSVFFGVCGGLGEYFGVDSTIIRIVFVILAIWGGAGVLFYIIAILVMPSGEGENVKKEIHEKAKEFSETVKETAADFKENVHESKVEKKGGYVFGTVILLLGIMFLLQNFFSWFNFNVFWPVILILIGIIFITGAGRRR